MSHDVSTSSPYRKVSVCTWSDQKVRSLSPILPSGQALFLILLVGPQTTNIPGLQPIGRLAFAEQLDWSPEAFDEAFAEAYREGLVESDWKARLVFVPKAIKHNLPQSHNVIKGWSATWARIPECDLKNRAWKVIHDALMEFNESFADTFKTACPLALVAIDNGLRDDSVKPTGKPTGKPTEKATDIQKQEQEQKQEGEPSAAASPPADLPTDRNKTEKTGKPSVQFKTFIAECKAKGEKPIPEDDAVFDWADKTGVPIEFLRIAWFEFRSRYTDSTKRYKDWRKVFRNAIKDNWYRLWYFDGGQVLLTSQGRLIEKSHSEELG